MEGSRLLYTIRETPKGKRGLGTFPNGPNLGPPEKNTLNADVRFFELTPATHGYANTWRFLRMPRTPLSFSSFEIASIPNRDREIEETRLSARGEAALASPADGERTSRDATFGRGFRPRTRRIGTKDPPAEPRGPRDSRLTRFSPSRNFPFLVRAVLRARGRERERLDARSRSPCSVTQPRLHDTAASSFPALARLFFFPRTPGCGRDVA